MSLLCIQSLVVSGNVGNKCAVYPLQLFGIQVDTINTVNFSNHTGYPVVKGEKLSSDQFTNLIQGLGENDLLDYSMVLSGYVGSPQVLALVQKLVLDLKSKKPTLFVLDPVMGDNGYLYVSKDSIPIYKEMISIADIVTPNAFELQLLTDIEITDLASALKAIGKLHSMGAKVVILTSVEFPNESGMLHLICSCDQIFKISFKKLNFNFTGTGDLFAALLLANIYKLDNNLKVESLIEACERTVASVQGILVETINWIHEKYSDEEYEALPRAMKMRLRELRIVQNRRHLESPLISSKALNLYFE